MLYPFITEPDGTEIVYSDIFYKDNDPTAYVRIEMERPNNSTGEFDSMRCILPNGKLSDVVGFTDGEVQKHQKILDNLTEMILECAMEERAR